MSYRFFVGNFGKDGAFIRFIVASLVWICSSLGKKQENVGVNDVFARRTIAHLGKGMLACV